MRHVTASARRSSHTQVNIPSSTGGRLTCELQLDDSTLLHCISALLLEEERHGSLLQQELQPCKQVVLLGEGVQGLSVLQRTEKILRVC